MTRPRSQAGHWGLVRVLSFWNKKRDMTLSPASCRHPASCPPRPAILALLCCLFASCSSTRELTQLAEHLHRDTVYLHNVRYDSVYIWQDKYLDRSKDTIYLRDKQVEYRYKMLRDTVRVIEKDSIPYPVVVTKEKPVRPPMYWYLLPLILLTLILIQRR